MRKVLSLFVLIFTVFGFNKVKLSSGTEVIYKQDRSYPLVSVAIGIEAGSSYEAPEEKGLSHFLEHMLFDGTYRRDRNGLEDSFARLGTYYNAFTRKDYVVFEFVSPTSQLIPSMKLITEMLFLSAFPPKEFSKEKGVVYQEIMKDYANPMTASEYEFYRHFLPSSPYSEPVLGYPQIIKNLEKERVMDFWRRYYAPSRMKVVIIGDFDLQKVKGELERLFSFPRKGVKTTPAEVSPAWDGVKRIKGRIFRLDIALPAPSPCSERASAYEILALVLGARIKNLLSLPYLSSEYEKHRGFAFLHFSSMPSGKMGRTDLAIEKALFKPIKKDEVSRAKREFFASRIMLFEKKIHMAREVAGWSILCPGRDWEEYIEQVKRIAPGQVEEARKWIKARGEYFALFQSPLLSEKPKFSVTSPKISSATMKNGLEYATLDLPGTVYAAHVLLKNRASLEKFPGQAKLLLKTLEIELQDKFDSLGVSVQFTDYPFFPFDDFYLSKDYAYMRFEGFSREAVEEAVCLALTVRIDPQAFQRAKGESLRDLAYLSSKAPWVAAERLRALLLPYPLSLPLYGNPSLIKGAEFKDLVEFRNSFLSSGNLIYTSSFSSLPRCLKSIKGSAPVKERPQKISLASEKFRRAAFSLGWKVRCNSKNYPVFLLLAHALRDALVEDVREKRGLAYSVGVSFVPYHGEIGLLRINIPTTKEKLPQVREVVWEVVKGFKPGKISGKKLEILKSSLSGRLLRYGERKINRAYYMGYYMYLGLPADYLWRLPSLVERLARAEVQKLWDGLSEPVEVSVK